ncbi:MAG: hypothetical protein ACK5M1_08990 [Xanthomarina gelatinilytica]|uniref:hypothetical protein n=1 Tax=Xanthomarina gelatinilytica TaxID=1137281 RepID=UPI003A8B52A2
MIIKRIKIKVKRLAKELFYKQYYVFGDSHTEIFTHMNKKKYDWNYSFDVTLVGGATAQGMRNPNSYTNALGIFTKKIKTIKNKKTKLFFLLGEVDTGFVIWYRALKYKESIDDQLNKSLQAYVDFINGVKAMGFNNIYVLSAPLPTIEDNQDWGEIANARKVVTATKIERTLLTLKYNKSLEVQMKNIGVIYISLDEELINAETGLLKENFLNKDINNHHLDIDKYAEITYKKIKKFI